MIKNFTQFINEAEGKWKKTKVMSIVFSDEEIIPNNMYDIELRKNKNEYLYAAYDVDKQILMLVDQQPNKEYIRYFKKVKNLDIATAMWESWVKDEFSPLKLNYFDKEIEQIEYKEIKDIYGVVSNDGEED